MKSVEHIDPPAPVTVVVINYIPALSGYYAQSLAVLQRCLSSIVAHTEGDYELMVFDNASCAEVRDYLLAEQAAGRIQYLTLADRNLGKSAAWNIALAAAPGETVVYTDADVYFHPGWLPATLQALEDFPQAGMVSAKPLLTPPEKSPTTLKWLETQDRVEVERGKLFPWEDYWPHAGSLGHEADHAREFWEQHQAVRMTREGREYFVGAVHFQFAAPKAVLAQALPIPPEQPMGHANFLLDIAIDKAGYLRLCTAETYVDHMGNVLPEEVAAPRTTARSRRHLPGPLVRLLEWLHNKTFEALYRR
jgi:hypothetical protein